MLILTRNLSESVLIGDTITVTVLGVKGSKVRLGIAAPRSMSVDRNEVRERKQHDPLSVCPGCGCFRDKCACDFREQRR